MDSSELAQEVKATGVRLCLDCGKCTAVCPVANHDPNFNPRRLVYEAQRDPAALGTSIWACLNCGLCTERCGYQVKLPEFITGLRQEAACAGASVACSHGGALQAVARTMAGPNSKQNRLAWVPDDIVRDEESDTAFFVGCAPYFDVVFNELGVKTLDGVVGALRLLNRARMPFRLLENERCCGHDLLLQGDRKGFEALAQANLDEFGRRGIKRIITYCPECYDCLKVQYPEQPGYRDIEVLHLLELIGPQVADGRVAFDKGSQKLTFHDPCSLGRGFRLFDAPRQLLDAIPGIERVEMEDNRESALCCGSCAWVFCGPTHRKIQGRRLAQAAKTGADVLVTACPKCLIHLKCAQKDGKGAGSGMEIRDLAALSAERLKC